LFKEFCDAAKLGNHKPEDLAKFGYRLDTKVLKFNSPFIFFLHSKNPICKNLVIFQMAN
jgi:hypothetical protein